MGQRSLYCDKCGAGYSVDENRVSMFCAKCGNNIIIPQPSVNNNVNQVYGANTLYYCSQCGKQNSTRIGAPNARCIYCGNIDAFNTPVINPVSTDDPGWKSTVCPSCGGKLNISSLSDMVKCDFCGTCFTPNISYVINKENIQSAEHIREMELEAERINRANQEKLAREQLALEREKMKIDKKRLKIEKKMARKGVTVQNIQKESFGGAIVKGAAAGVASGLIRRILK